MSICSDNLADLKALKAVRTTSPLVHQCQRVLNDISVWHVVGLLWVPRHAEYGVMKSPMGLRGAALSEIFRTRAGPGSL